LSASPLCQCLGGFPRGPRPVRLERTNALRITPGKSDPRLTGQLGEGHAFRPCTRGQQTWCDLCGDFVWGGPRKSLQCAREYRAGGSAHPCRGAQAAGLAEVGLLAPSW
uniref:Uncharacterized protein n=1 Tax=Chelydra serpentina TaxID=8475 RepID=A0A8C3TEG9_CHESE